MVVVLLRQTRRIITSVLLHHWLPFYIVMFKKVHTSNVYFILQSAVEFGLGSWEGWGGKGLVIIPLMAGNLTENSLCPLL